MPQAQPPHEHRPVMAIGHDIRANFAELWVNLKDRVTHTFDRLDAKDVLTVRSLDDLKRLVKHAYLYDDARVDEEVDRFVNEGGATGSSAVHGPGNSGSGTSH